MNARLAQWQEKFQALSLRERGLVVGMLGVALVIAWMELLWSAQGAGIEQQRSELLSRNAQAQANRTQLDALRAAAGRDPDRQAKQQRTRLQQQLARLDASLKEKMQGLIAPAQMARVVEAVLTRQTDLRLQRIRNLPTRPLIPLADNESREDADAGVYRHGLQIEFSGSYLGTLEYLKALQALPWDFYWDELQLEVQQYPRSHIVITVHTLSLREGWIGV